MPGGNSDQLRAVVCALLEGDPVLWKTLKEQLTRYVDLRASGLHMDKENLVSDIMETVLSNLREDRFRGTNVKMLYGYIYGIARLKVLCAVRTAAITINQSDHDELTREAVSPNNHERLVESKDLAAKIFAALDPRSREVLTLRFCEGWTDQEIADHLKMTKGAVATAISRAIRRAQDLDIIRGIM